MAIIWTEGFDDLTGYLDLSPRGFAHNVSSGGQVPGRYGGNSFYIGNIGQYYAKPPVDFSGSSTHVFHLGIKALLDAAGGFGKATNYSFFGFEHSASNWTIFCLNPYRISFVTNCTSYTATGLSNGTQQAEAYFSRPRQDSWIHLQIKVHADPTVGFIEIRVDGQTSPVINWTNQNIPALDAVGFLNSGDFEFHLSDFVVVDGTGSSNNDFLGDVRVQTLFPTADSTVQFSPAASNYTYVDENNDDGDTSFVSSSTVGHQDLLVSATLSASATSVYAVAPEAMARKDDAGNRNLKLLTRTGGTTYASPEEILNASYFQYKHIQNTNPNTSSAWTPAEVNAATFGYEVA